MLPEVRCQCHRLLARQLEGRVEIKCPRCNAVHTIDTAANSHLTHLPQRVIMKPSSDRVAAG